MALEIKLTRAYQKEKSAFISANGENAMLVSTIKRLERKLLDVEPHPNTSNLYPLLLFEETHLTLPSLSVLGCLCLVNFSFGEAAPCYLFFTGKQSLEPLSRNTLTPYVKAVKEELGW